MTPDCGRIVVFVGEVVSQSAYFWIVPIGPHTTQDSCAGTNDRSHSVFFVLSPHRRRPLGHRIVRAPLSCSQIRGAPQRPAADLRSAEREGRGGHRSHAGSRHQTLLERAARRRQALRTAHEARGEPSSNRCGAGCDRRATHLRDLGARSLVELVGKRYEGKNVLGRLCMEVCQQLRDDDQAARSGAWISRIRVGCLAGRNGVLAAAPYTPPVATTLPSSGFSNPRVSSRRQYRRRNCETPATRGAVDPFGRLLP